MEVEFIASMSEGKISVGRTGRIVMIGIVQFALPRDL